MIIVVWAGAVLALTVIIGELRYRYLRNRGENMGFDEKVNCNTCKHGYFKGIDDWHNLCGKDNCYACAMNVQFCDDYEEGQPPDGTEKMWW